VFIDGYLGRSEKSGEQWATLGWAWLERSQWPRDLLREQLGNLALVHRTFDRHVDAIVEITLALSLAHGEGETAARAALLAALAETYRKFGRRDLARETAVQAHDAYVAALGERHPYSINALNLVAGVDMEQGKFEAAEVTLRRAIALGEEVLGKDSRRLIDPRANLASVLVNTGRVAEGVALRQQIYDTVTAPGEPRNETRVLVIANFATDVAMSGDMPRARELQREAMELAREVGGPDSALYARQMSTAAELVLDIDPERALVNARQAEEVLQRVAPASIERSIAGTTAAIALVQLERCDEATDALATGLASLEAQVGKEHPALSGLLAARGHCESEAGRHDEAIALLERAARLNDTVMPPNPTLLEWQARAHLAHGDRKRARELYDRLVEVLEPDAVRGDAVAKLAKALGAAP
jgi:tetratricopeptide (TPR) repeat protein